jgi:isovaleryl-CoA dehydrogenase
LTGSKFEVNEHTPYAKRAGVSDKALNEVSEGKRLGEGRGLSEEQWATLRYAEATTRDVVVSREVFEGVRKFLNDKQVVELAATVAAINCAARFLKALDVGEFDE